MKRQFRQIGDLRPVRPLTECLLNVKVDSGINGKFPSRRDQIDIEERVLRILFEDKGLSFVFDLGISFNQNPVEPFPDNVDYVISILAQTNVEEISVKSADPSKPQLDEVGLIDRAVQETLVEEGFNVVRTSVELSGREAGRFTG